MAKTFKFGENGKWATKTGSSLAYNDQNDNFKPMPFSVIRDSIATRVNKEGLIEVVGNDKLRIDYKDSTKGVALLEPARTNIVIYSDDFSNAAWFPTPSLVTVTSNQFISPDGTLNADRLQIQSTSSIALLPQLVSHTINVKITVSAWVKSNTNSVQKIKLFGDYGTPNAVSSEFIVEDYWKRIEFTFTPTATGNRNVGFYNVSNLATDIQIFGFQAEVGSYATSYIPTSGAAVPRAADVANGAGNSEVFNDSEGVLFANIAALVTNESDTKRITLSDGTTSNRFTLYLGNSRVGLVQVSASVVNINQILQGYDVAKYLKVAGKYKTDDFALWINGFKVFTDNSGNSYSEGVLDRINFDRGDGVDDFYGKAKEIGVYDAVLTDAELEALTSYTSFTNMANELNLTIK